ncbi:uncharacterized protein [Oscarella lobularis]|uniref:uncharacterized protein n=1 Tax=Oscarella lobularis TaxID=121494 RepID=UPI0033144136
MSSSCFNYTLNVSFENSNNSRLFFSYLRYCTTNEPWVKLTLWIVSGLAIICNVGVIIWRVNRSRVTNLSIVIINLAISDCLVAVSHLIYLSALLTIGDWLDEPSLLTASLCSVSSATYRFSSRLTGSVCATIAALGLKELCCYKRSTKRSFVIGILIAEWVIGVVLTGATAKYFRDELTWSSSVRNRTMNWIMCWSHDAIGQGKSIAVLSTFVAFTGLIAVSYLGVIVLLCRWSTGRQRTQAKPVILRLGVVIFVTAGVVSINVGSDIYIMRNKTEYASFDSELFRSFEMVVALSTPFLAVLNPFLYTLVTKPMLISLRGALFRSDNGSEMTTPEGGESTLLFPETSLDY